MKVQQKEAGWVNLWCKANPSKKDKREQAFREHSRSIFTGKCKELTKGSKSRGETSPAILGGNGGQGPGEMPGAG